ncbi:hypothetical protein ABPG72_016334 [Tetrahymena utriculariae]
MVLFQSVEKFIQSEILKETELELYFLEKPTKEQVQRLANQLLKNVNLEKLQLMVNIFVDDSSFISDSISSLKNLKTLNVFINYNSVLGSIGVNNITKPIQSLEYLKNLSLSFPSCKIEDNKLYELGTALSKCSNLVSLQINFYNNSLGQLAVTSIFEDLNSLRSLDSLDLCFQHNKICIQGCFSICKAIKNMTNLAKLKLNFNYNTIEDQGLQYIAEAISQLDKIIQIDIKADYNFISKKGLIDLNQSVSKLLKLEKLVYSLNGDQIGNGGFSSFLLLKENKKIKDLCLSFNSIHIFKEDISQLGCLLSSLLNLIYLQLSFNSNKFKIEVLIELGKQIGQSQSIQILNLNLANNQIQQEDFIQFVEAISGCSNLREIFIDSDFNNFGQGEIGQSQLGKAFSSYQQLQSISLNLNFNQLVDKDIFDFSYELKNCKNLLKIQISAQDNLLSNQCNYQTKVLLKKFRKLVSMGCLF